MSISAADAVFPSCSMIIFSKSKTGSFLETLVWERNSKTAFSTDITSPFSRNISAISSAADTYPPGLLLRSRIRLSYSAISDAFSSTNEADSSVKLVMAR